MQKHVKADPVIEAGYNGFMRKKSAVDQAMRQSLVESARRMTRRARLVACINLSRLTAELERSGKRHRAGRPQNSGA